MRRFTRSLGAAGTRASVESRSRTIPRLSGPISLDTPRPGSTEDVEHVVKRTSRRARSPRRRRRRRSAFESRFAGIRALVCAVGAGVMLSAALCGPLTTQSAYATTQVQEAAGLPGEQVTVLIRNDEAVATAADWILAAPPGTHIVGASGMGMSTAFPCEVVGQTVRCGPPAPGGWALGDTVTLTLEIDAAAAAGEKIGVSTIAGNASDPFAVIVLAPPAPAITSPADGLRTLEASPTIAGDKRAANGVTVFIDGSLVCTIPADTALTWSCIPAVPLAVGAHAITAVQTSPAGDSSPAEGPISVEVLGHATLSVKESGAKTAFSGARIERIVTVTNVGPASTEAVAVAVDLDGFPATECAAGATRIDCDLLPDGADIGDLAPGSSERIHLSGRLRPHTPAGTVFTITASAVSVNDATSPVTAVGTITVADFVPPRGGSTPGRPPQSPPAPPPPRAVPPTPVVDTRPGPPPSVVDTVPESHDAVIDAPPMATAPPMEDAGTLAIDLRTHTGGISPGTASTLRGTIGPNRLNEAVTATFTGVMNKGVAYRSVQVGPDGKCVVSGTRFSCTVTLRPGESAEVAIRLAVDPLNGPDVVRQQLTLSSSANATANTMTSTVSVGDDESPAPAGAGFALDMARFPGAFLPLLSLLLFALAARQTQRRRSRRIGATSDRRDSETPFSGS